jgi:hypothetical protein
VRELRDIVDVIDDHTGRSRAVLEYSLIMSRAVAAAKQPDFSATSWKQLEQLVAVDTFERIGNFKEVMTWDSYVSFLTDWAPTAEWSCSFKRISETGDLVFLELEERIAFGDLTSAVNSLSVYEFDADDKIRHLDIYLQMPLPPDSLPAGYEGVELSG